MTTFNTPIAHTRWAMSLWDEASSGCSAGVKQLSLKGIREVRCRLPRSGAWLRGSMVSPNEAGLNPRETIPLPRNIIPCIIVGWWPTSSRGSERTQINIVSKGYRDRLIYLTSPKDETGYLVYPVSVRDTAESGMGCTGNRHLNYLAEFTSTNVGGLHQDAKLR